jgi:glutathione S-transferase
MLHLHYSPSDASLAPHMLLEEIGAPFVLKRVDRSVNAQKSPAYLKLNPNGLIPVLEDGALVLFETAAILLHLADIHPHAQLVPALGTPPRAHFYKWLMWLANTLHATVVPFFYPQRWADDPGAVAQVKSHAEARAGQLLDLLDAELARHAGPWLLGDAYSAADPYALMLGCWTRHFKRPAKALPHLGPYLRRVQARPAVQRALHTEGLAPDWGEPVPGDQVASN